MLIAVVFVIAAYLIGSLSFAVIVSKAFGLPDPHSYGSGNPGATNVLRSGKKLAALLTLAGDAGKGWLAVILALLISPQFPPGEQGSQIVAGVAFAVFLGHLFPLYFGFKGGKGVATALGILLAINVWLGLATLATWIIIAVFFRISSLAAIISAVFAPFCTFWWFGLSPYTFAVLGISLLLVWRHEANIRKLLAGQESRIGQKAAPRP
jgi:glycerol-3-phosphate acyltransferase PlsY